MHLRWTTQNINESDIFHQKIDEARCRIIRRYIRRHPIPVGHRGHQRLAREDVDRNAGTKFVVAQVSARNIDRRGVAKEGH